MLFAVCLTDSQIVRTLNELIEATKKIWRELELNVSAKARSDLLNLN